MKDADKTAMLKTDVYKKAQSALLLYLDNKVLREVNKEDYIVESRSLWKIVLSSLNSRELKKRTDAKDDGDGLYVRGRSDHRGNQGRSSSRLKSKGKGTYKLKCYICYSEDHLKKDCLKRNKKKLIGFVKKNVGQVFGMHSDDYNNGDLLMAMSEERFLEWIINFGGSFHMTPRMDFLFDFKEFNGGTVLLGDNRACANIGIGKVRVHMKDGYIVKLDNGRVMVINGSLMVLSENMKGNCVYSLDGWAESGEASIGIQENESLAQVWHKRLGHISEAGLHELERRYHTTEEVIDYVHADLWGPSRQVQGVEEIGGKPDRIARNLAVARTLQQNGLAKRMNRTLLNKVRCLLIQSGLRDSFWVEATVTSAYLINRSPSTALEKKTPMDLWDTNYGDFEKEVEFEVELQGSRVEPTVDPHTEENLRNEDKEQDEGPQQQNLENYVLVCDSEKRTTTIPARYKDEGNVSLSRPSRSKEAIKSSKKDEWVRALEEEMSSLNKNHTWELVDQPPGQKLVSCKWLYKIKEGVEGIQKPRYKARLVARGFTQRAWIDYNEVFSPVVRHICIRVILSLTACEDYELEQLDVKTAFLHGNLEIIYMRNLVLKKERATRVDNGKSISMPLGAHFKVSLKDCPSSNYDVEIISKVPYANVVDSLMYLMVCTRPDIAYDVSIVSMYLVNPGKNHWDAVKWILKYLKGTADVGIVYGKDQGKHVDVDSFIDASYAKDPDKGRSIIRYVFMVHGGVVSWKATLQHIVPLSTTEAVYMALTKAVKKSIWLKGLLIELGVNLRSVVMNCDNQSAIHLLRNAMFHEKTKHINVRYHFIREIMESKEIEVAKIGTKDNVADAFIKVVLGSKFKYCIEILGVGTF
nr:retrovirus-related Pol polyprotein from transposon TNT 1-94 [Tanacetum cinerariifolium]